MTESDDMEFTTFPDLKGTIGVTGLHGGTGRQGSCEGVCRVRVFVGGVGRIDLLYGNFRSPLAFRNVRNHDALWCPPETTYNNLLQRPTVFMMKGILNCPNIIRNLMTRDWRIWLYWILFVAAFAFRKQESEK